MFEEAVTHEVAPTLDDTLTEIAEAETKQQKQLAKHLATAMESLAKLAKYYKRHGCLPTFTAIEHSPVARPTRLKLTWQPDNLCATCHQMFIGPISARCQCKVQTKRKAEVA